MLKRAGQVVPLEPPTAGLFVTPYTAPNATTVAVAMVIQVASSIAANV
jgi:hypothetical protein